MSRRPRSSLRRSLRASGLRTHSGGEHLTATARNLALLVYRMLRYRTPYHELSAADYDRQQRSRILRGLRRRAASLGFELADNSTGLVM